MEEWRTIKGVDGYEVSNTGKVRNACTGRVLSGADNGSGYKKVCLGAKRKEYIHRLVAMAFLGERGRSFEVNHIDGDPHNNHVSNLEWVTSSENTKHAVYRGALCPWGNQARAIKSIDIETGAERVFATLSEAERFYGSRHIVDVLKERRFQCKGQRFEYLKGGDASANFDYSATEHKTRPVSA